MFGRKDIPPKHIRTLLERGFLPISTDYRLCPEMTLYDGPMQDCCDVLQWATEVLPGLDVLDGCTRVDPKRVLSMGWSSGGQLAMSMSYLARARGIKAPDVVIAMYPPSDMASERLSPE